MSLYPVESFQSPVKASGLMLPPPSPKPYLQQYADRGTKYNTFVDKRLYQKMKKAEAKADNASDLCVFTATNQTETFWVVCPAGAVWRVHAWYMSDCPDGLSSLWHSHQTLWTAPKSKVINKRKLEPGAMIVTAYMIHVLEQPSQTKVGRKVPSLSSLSFEIGKLAEENYLTSVRDRRQVVSVLYRELPKGLAKDVVDALMRDWTSSDFIKHVRGLPMHRTPPNSPLKNFSLPHVLPKQRKTSQTSVPFPTLSD